MKALHLLIILLFTSQIYGQDFKYSIVRNDNDYVTYRDIHSFKETTPQPIVKKFKSIINGLKCDSQTVYSYSYKININENVDIYSLFVDYNFNKDCYLIAFNKTETIITEFPIVINMKWSFNNEDGFNFKLLKFPLIDIKQNDGNYTVCLKERVHNGNIYNAVIDKIYILDKYLSFNLKFCYEETSLTFDNQKIKRILNNDTILVYKENDISFEYLGKIEIDSKAKTIVKKECINDELCPILFTASGEEDEYILKNGVTIKY